LADQIEKKEMDGASSAYGERGGSYRILVGRPVGRRPLEDPGIDGGKYANGSL